MLKISVRKATADDIEGFKTVVFESVLALCKGYYTFVQLNSLIKQYPGCDLYKKWIDKRVLVVAEHEGRIVGFAQYFPSHYSIEAVHVLPSYVNQGIGRTLLRFIEETAKKQGAEKIVLSSSLNATGFYEKCGYTRKDEEMFKCNDGVELEVVKCEKQLLGYHVLSE